VHPRDPLLARAAWGLRVDVGAGGQSVFDLAGPVDGRQSAQRAEVTAALASTQAVAEPVELVSDSRWVVNSVAALAAGASPADWQHADLWERIAPHVRTGRLRARWTPAHKSAEEYRDRGLAERDRLGNDAADGSAGAAAAARLPAASIVAAREQQVEQLWNVQRLLALTELAALTANHRRIGDAPPRVRRRWADIRRGARAASRAVSAPRAALQQPAPNEIQQPAGPPPPLLHALERDGGTLSCRLCGKKATRARWTALAYGKCSAHGGGVRGSEWRRVSHRIEEVEGVVRCTRCRGSVPAHRRATFVDRRCPAWWAAAPAGDAADADGAAAEGGGDEATVAGGGDWGAWIFALLGHDAAGAARSRAASAGPRVAVPPPPAAAQPAARPACTQATMQALLSGKAWQPHASASGPRLVACLRCGASAPAWSRLAATPCGGWTVALPPRVAALVLLGNELQCAGGSPGAFADALRRRMNELPAAPD
jgi:hypothetical protein